MRTTKAWLLSGAYNTVDRGAGAEPTHETVATRCLDISADFCSAASRRGRAENGEGDVLCTLPLDGHAAPSGSRQDQRQRTFQFHSRYRRPGALRRQVGWTTTRNRAGQERLGGLREF